MVDVEEFPRFRWYVQSLRVLSAVLSASSFSEGPCIFNNKLYFALAKGLSQCLVGHSIVGERAPSRIYTGCICLYVRVCMCVWGGGGVWVGVFNFHITA